MASNSNSVPGGLIDKIFSSPLRKLELKRGDILLKCGEPNDRLYYIHKGTLSGGEPKSQGGEMYECLFAGAGDLLGLRSFFSDDIPSHATVVADEDCSLSYVTMRDLEREHTEPRSNLLMPLFSEELYKRQKTVYDMMKKDHELDRLNFLGQFSAGVAHELNNALAVIVRGTEWMSKVLDSQMKKMTQTDYMAFNKGVSQGRPASKDARASIKPLQQKTNWSYSEAKKISQMGLSEQDIQNIKKHSADRRQELVDIWELGATFRDVSLSSEHAASVVESMKSLGAKGSLMMAEVDLAETIQLALVVSRNVIKNITIEDDLKGKQLSVLGNKGELVQVWTNLIKNASDAMYLANTKDKKIIISSELKENRVILSIQDTGPGIPEEAMPKIFMPNFTTKKSGLQFGLGLGLSIVHKILQSSGGFISAKNTELGACFNIYLPLFQKGEPHA